MKLLFSLVMFFFLINCQGEQGNPKDIEQIRNNFDLYQKSIMEDSGKQAVELVNKNTIDYYDKILKLSLTANKDEVQSLRLIDKLVVLMIRHNMKKEDLTKMSARELFIYAVDNGWVGKNSVMEISIGDISIKDNFAKAQVIHNGKKTELYHQFNKEENSWKLDLVKILETGNMAFKKNIEKSGMEEDNFLFMILESISGKKVIDDIWNPIIKEK